MPNRLGRYVVRRRIGAGSFATVWLAYDDQLDSPVAIKVLADNWAGDFDVRRRFVEEGRFLRKVESPHVVSVYDAGELEDERPYLVMTYADQGTLADRLADGPLDPATGIEVIRQVGLGLDALHRRQVLHRDVKPANVLFRTGDDDGVRAMLGDLGLGKSLDMSSRLTLIAGTPSYVAPEQAQGESLDARADQYSLGALAYLVLTGRPPYQHESLAAAASPGPPPPMLLGNDDLEDAIERSLDPDRDERWPSVRSFVDALASAGVEGVASPLPVDLGRSDLTRVGRRPSPRPTQAVTSASGPSDGRPASRRGRRALAAVLALLALAGGGVAGYQAQRGARSDVHLDDATGTISVTVPRAWSDQVGDDGWIPPDQELTYPALRVGGGQATGLFAGILPGKSLPTDLPGHPQCGEVRPAVHGRVDQDPATTVVHTGCPGVIVERVVQVAGNRILWVQVRSQDQGTANAVLDSLETHGLG